MCDLTYNQFIIKLVKSVIRFNIHTLVDNVWERGYLLMRNGCSQKYHTDYGAFQAALI